MLEQNKEKDKALNQSYNLFWNNVFRLIKGVFDEKKKHIIG
ncbi:hypothetical protein [Staphylococcus aureus]